MALLAMAGLTVARPQRQARGLVAFHYAAVFDQSAVDWYTRFALVVTGGFIDPVEARKLTDRGSRLIAYEWSSAFYPGDPVSASRTWQAEVLQHSAAWLVNSQPSGGGAAAPGRAAFWYDFANPELRSARAAYLAARVGAGGYAGLFLDTLGFESLPRELRQEFTARNPDADYNREQAAFLAALRTALGPNKILFLNQGYRHCDLFLPYADYDLTESYFVSAPASGTLFRPWHDPARPWESILTPMDQLVVPASRRFPGVKFVHLGYATGPAVTCRRAIGYNLAAARLWNQGAYLVADSPAGEQDEGYFAELGLPLGPTYGHDAGEGVAWREFEGGVVALNAGTRTASILGGRYELPDPPRGYLFR